MIQISYVLPLKWTGELDRDELTAYLDRLSDEVDEVIVVDGSDPGPLQDGIAAWGTFAKVLVPDADLDFDNGKVNGVTTGIRAASNDKVVVADDDVRYGIEGLRKVAALLDKGELVSPQNYFACPLPWHAYIDGARSLLNRAVGHDFPGTLGVRRDFFLEIGGYDGNVLFENLELIRTVKASGGTVIADRSIYVPRIPPTTRRYLTQRVRQAYDDFAQPARMAVWFSLLPSTLFAALSGKSRWILIGSASSIGLAEHGRRKDRGTEVFPPTMSLCAPVWLTERAITAWVALIARLRGGVVYAGKRIKRSARP